MNLFPFRMCFIKSSCLLCCLFLFAMFGCDTHERTNSHYTVDAHINTHEQSIKVSVDITYLPSEATKSIAFIAHENVNLQSCKAKNLLNFVEAPATNKAKTITLNFNEEVGNWVTIHFEYDFVFKAGDAPWGIDKISEDWIELSLNSGWLPIIASFDNQFTSETELHIVSNNTFSVLSSGASRSEGHNTFSITNSIPQIDLVLIGSSEFQESSKGTISIFQNQENKERDAFIFNFSEKSYDWLNTTFGAVKELPPVKLVITPREESGYARKNFIVLSNDISVSDTLHFVNYITHEFAHYWSTGANPLSEHRWLDESIAEYVTWKFIRTYYNKTKWNEFLDRAKKEADTIPPVYILGESKTPSHAVMYRKGVYKLYQLEQMIGEEKMLHLLSDWFKVEKKNSEHFLNKLANMADLPTAENFRIELSK